MPPNRSSPSGRRSKHEDTDNDFEDHSGSDDSNHDKVKVLRNLLWLLPIVLASLLLIMGSLYIHMNQASDNISGARNVIKHVGKNLKAKPLVAIENKPKATACPAGEEELTLAEFGGVEAGCLCHDGTIHSRAYCVLHSFSNTCYYVKAVAEGKTKNINALHFCVKRNTEWKHVKPTAQCGANFAAAKCFTNYCIATADAGCGYNTLTGNPTALNMRLLSIGHNHSQATHNTAMEPNHFPTTSDADVIGAPNNIKIKYVAANPTASPPVPEAMPFIELAVVTGTKPCWDTQLREEKQSKKSYPLLTVKETGCGEFQTFDDVVPVYTNKKKYKEFYDDNNLGTALEGEKFWADYYDNAQDFVSVVLVRKIKISGTDDVCYNINPADIDKIEDQITTLKQDINGIFIAVLSISALMLLIALVFYVFKDKTFLHFDFKTRSSTKVLIILGVIASILVIAAGIVYYVRESNTSQFQAEYQKYIDKKCFEGYENSIIKALKVVLKYLNEQHGDMGHLTVGAFATGIAFIGSIAIALVLKHKTGTPVFDGPFIRD